MHVVIQSREARAINPMGTLAGKLHRAREHFVPPYNITVSQGSMGELSSKALAFTDVVMKVVVKALCLADAVPLVMIICWLRPGNNDISGTERLRVGRVEV